MSRVTFSDGQGYRDRPNGDRDFSQQLSELAHVLGWSYPAMIPRAIPASTSIVHTWRDPSQLLRTKRKEGGYN